MQTNILRLPASVTDGGQRIRRKGIGGMGDVTLCHLERSGFRAEGVERIADHQDSGCDPCDWRDNLMLAMFEALTPDQRQQTRLNLVQYKYAGRRSDSGAEKALQVVGGPSAVGWPK